MCRQNIMNLGPRRKSVDVGGLALALGETGSGSGWMGGEESEGDEAPPFAELLSDMVTHTRAEVSENAVEQPPIDIPPETRQQLIYSLDSWNFEPHKLPDEVGVAAALILFEALFHVEGMEADVGCSLRQLAPFLWHLRQIYRHQNSYHNFHHALDVLQATHVFLSSAGLVPKATILSQADDGMWRSNRPKEGAFVECLTNTDIFALYIAAIGHDVGHPGLTNKFMENAHTPLSVVYNNQSALEQMHCALLLQVMRTHGLGVILSKPGTGAFFRELLSKTVLATDMSIHFKFMSDLEALVKGANVPLTKQKILLCQAFMKCSDISNPSRPLGVSRYWANALMIEWTNQAALERHLHLPLTLQPSDTPLREAKSQVFFIKLFAKPLFDLTARAIPEVNQYATQCSSNLASWEVTEARLLKQEALNDVTPAPRPPVVSPTELADVTLKPTELPGDFLGAFPLTLPANLVPADLPSPPSPTSQTPTSSFFPSGPSSAPTSPPPSRTPSPTMPGAFIHSSPPRAASSPLRLSGMPPSPRPALRSPVENSFAVHARTLSGVSAFSSASGSSSRASTQSADQHAIRAALKAGVRKKKSFHQHRASWNPVGPMASPREFGAQGPTSPTAMLFPRAAAVAANKARQ